MSATLPLLNHALVVAQAAPATAPTGGQVAAGAAVSLAVTVVLWAIAIAATKTSGWKWTQLGFGMMMASAGGVALTLGGMGVQMLLTVLTRIQL